MTAPDPKTVREIAREAIRSASQRLELIDSVIARHRAIGDRPASGSGELMTWHATYNNLCRAVRAEMQAASWPDEQQPAEATGGEQVQDGAVGRVRATLDRHAARGSSGGEYDDADIRAVLDNREAWRNLAKSRGAERDALAARVAELEARPRIEIKPGRELTDDEVQALTDRFTMPAGRVVFLDADPTKES